MLISDGALKRGPSVANVCLCVSRLQEQQPRHSFALLRGRGGGGRRGGDTVHLCGSHVWLRDGPEKDESSLSLSVSQES